jgi:hypothetical protein
MSSTLSDWRTAYVKAQGEKARSLAEELAEAAFDHCLSACESPIEQAFLAALLLEADCIDSEYISQEMYGCLDYEAPDKPRHRALYTFSVDDRVLGDCQIHTQHPLLVEGALVRLDFALVVRPYPRRRDVCAARDPRLKRFAIECDGHDYHERTKAQAARDRSRDRKLTRAGWTVVRFTGSELYRDPSACVKELFAMIDLPWSKWVDA